MGFAEVLRHLPFFLRLRRRVFARARGGGRRPGHPHRLSRASTCASRGTPAAGGSRCSTTSPRRCGRGTRSRAADLARDADEVAVILPFEEEFLRGAGRERPLRGPPAPGRARRRRWTRDDVGGRARAGPGRAPCWRSSPARGAQEIRRHLALFSAAAAAVVRRAPGGAAGARRPRRPGPGRPSPASRWPLGRRPRALLRHAARGAGEVGHHHAGGRAGGHPVRGGLPHEPAQLPAGPAAGARCRTSRSPTWWRRSGWCRSSCRTRRTPEALAAALRPLLDRGEPRSGGGCWRGFARVRERLRRRRGAAERWRRGRAAAGGPRVSRGSRERGVGRRLRGGALLTALMRTLRYRVVAGEEHYAPLAGRAPAGGLRRSGTGGCSPAAYHHRQQGLATLISQHRDGDYIARVVERWGFHAVRGSSSRGGREALRAAGAAPAPGNAAGHHARRAAGPAREDEARARCSPRSSRGVPLIPVSRGQRPGAGGSRGGTASWSRSRSRASAWRTASRCGCRARRARTELRALAGELEERLRRLTALRGRERCETDRSAPRLGAALVARGGGAPRVGALDALLWPAGAALPRRGRGARDRGVRRRLAAHRAARRHPGRQRRQPGGGRGGEDARSPPGSRAPAGEWGAPARGGAAGLRRGRGAGAPGAEPAHPGLRGAQRAGGGGPGGGGGRLRRRRCSTTPSSTAPWRGDLDLVLVAAESVASPAARLLPRGPWREPPRRAAPRRRAWWSPASPRRDEAAEARRRGSRRRRAAPTVLCRTRARGAARARRTVGGTLRPAARAGRPGGARRGLAGRPEPLRGAPPRRGCAGGARRPSPITTTSPRPRRSASRRAAGGRTLVMTRKEAVKLRHLLAPGFAAWVLDQEVRGRGGRGGARLDLLRGALRR